MVCAFMLLLTLLIFCFGVREHRRVARSVRSEGELRDVRTELAVRLLVTVRLWREAGAMPGRSRLTEHAADLRDQPHVTLRCLDVAALPCGHQGEQPSILLYGQHVNIQC